MLRKVIGLSWVKDSQSWSVVEKEFQTRPDCRPWNIPGPHISRMVAGDTVSILFSPWGKTSGSQPVSDSITKVKLYSLELSKCPHVSRITDMCWQAWCFESMAGREVGWCQWSGDRHCYVPAMRLIENWSYGVLVPSNSHGDSALT